eukprot:g11370.t1.1.5e17418b g11370  g11370.t1 contig5:691415-693053(-)
MHSYNNRDGGMDEWRCMECGLDNDTRVPRCPRCGNWKDDRRGRGNEDIGARDDDGYYGPPRGDYPRRHSRDEDSDNYYSNNDNNPRSRKKSRGSSPPPPLPSKPQWPPKFESAGASYIFDARSGMFYEPATDFFYDPKTKYYYSNKKQAYFQYVEGVDPPFQALGGDGQIAKVASVESVASTAESTQPENVRDVSNVGSGEGKSVEQKSKIAISLKTSILSSKSPSTKPLSEIASIEKTKLKEKKIARKESPDNTPAVAPTFPQSHKQHAKDMDKWSERVKEMKEDATSTTLNSKAQSYSHSTPAAVRTTTSGQPICVLCKRKFANLEKLQQHEKLSALHKENLAKKAAADEANAAKQKEDANAEATYRDRSKERRMMYGTAADTSHADAILAQGSSLRSSLPSAQPKPTEVVRPDQTLGDTNVGNKLLQKLGWKSGEALGRKQDGENGGETKKGGGDAASKLKNDWERIESLAKGGGGRARR